MTAHLCAHPRVCSASTPKLGDTVGKWGHRKFFFWRFAQEFVPPTFNLLSALLRKSSIYVVTYLLASCSV